MIATVKEILDISFHKDLIILTLPWEDAEIFPGQFFMIGPESFENKDFILNRPFSVSDFYNNSVEFRIRIAGKFTNYLKTLKKGSTVRVIAPLGNYLSLDYYKNYDNILLVGGGIGVAPLLFFYRYLKNTNINVELLFGVQNRKFLHYLPENILTETFVATEDGSYGYRGYVTDILPDKLKKNSLIIACGPKPMYNALENFTDKYNVKVLLEARMACGFGVCLGCAVDTKNGYKRVCKEGPVFSLDYLTNF